MIPFPDFLQSVQVAEYGEFQGQSTCKVRSLQAFEQMRGYLLKRYQGYRVITSFQLGEQCFDCVIPETEPYPVRAVTCQTCPPGSIPLRRITLQELVGFPSLQASMRKFPDVS